MPERLIDIPFLTLLWVGTLSVCGGVANYINRFNKGIIKRFSVFEFVGELFISAFVGLVTYLFCRSAGLDELITGVVVGISGHMGTRAIYLIERAVNKHVPCFPADE